MGLLLGRETWILSADCGVAVGRGDLDIVSGLWGCCWEGRLGYCQRTVGLVLGRETWILSAQWGVAAGRGDLDTVSGTQIVKFCMFDSILQIVCVCVQRAV